MFPADSITCRGMCARLSLHSLKSHVFLHKQLLLRLKKESGLALSIDLVLFLPLNSTAVGKALSLKAYQYLFFSVARYISCSMLFSFGEDAVSFHFSSVQIVPGKPG